VYVNVEMICYDLLPKSPPFKITFIEETQQEMTRREETRESFPSSTAGSVMEGFRGVTSHITSLITCFLSLKQLATTDIYRAIIFIASTSIDSIKSCERGSVELALMVCVADRTSAWNGKGRSYDSVMIRYL
jgi:hypothetical protein